MQKIYLRTNHPSYYNRRFTYGSWMDGTTQYLKKPFLDQVEKIKYYKNNEAVGMLEINFNPGNGVNTTVDLPNTNAIKEWDKFTYCYIYDGSTLISTWYIENVEFIRGGIVRLFLTRDIVNDYYSDIITSTFFIERANIDTNNPLIYNNEGLQFNQIKTSETPIKLSECGWITGYIARNRTADTTLTNETPESQSPIINYSAWTDVPFYDFIETDTSTYKEASIPAFDDAFICANFQSYNNTGQQAGRYCYPFWKGQEANAIYYDGTNYHYINTFSKQAYKTYGNPDEIRFVNLTDDTFYPGFLASISTTVYNQLKELYTGDTLTEIFKADLEDDGKIASDSIIASALNYDGYIIHITSTNTYWKVKATTTIPSALLDRYERIKYKTNNLIYSDTNSLMESAIINPFVNDVAEQRVPYMQFVAADPSHNEDLFQLGFTKKIINVEINKIEVDSYSTNVPKTSDLPHSPDSPFDVFMIPYGDNITFKYNGSTYNLNKIVALDCVNKLITQMGVAIYDVQLLPYSPIDLTSDGMPTLAGLTSLYYDLIVDSNSVPIGFIYYPTELSFRRTKMLANPIVNPTDKIEFKVNNDCDVYRLVAPNYGGSFEFTATKNNGITGFEINCTLKPTQPYIHINPIWGGLYGTDFNDARGLVCSGDFSLSMATSAWENYKIQNKNYQLAFDRQIEHMEITNKFANIQAGISSASSASSTGIIAAAAFGNPIGLAAGVVSAIGGAGDLAIQRRLQKEQIGYSTDMFNYNLQNIQALPYTLNKVSSFDVDSKIFPFMEYYTCTEEEKQAFRQHLLLRGMTVNRFDTLNLYIESDYTYIKAKLVKLSNVNIPNAVANQIALEFEKGVYIK